MSFSLSSLTKQASGLANLEKLKREKKEEGLYLHWQNTICWDPEVSFKRGKLVALGTKQPGGVEEHQVEIPADAKFEWIER